jgi:microcystin-dependent protein
MNIDLRNTKTLTILAISCILVFTCVYVMIYRGNSLEGFADFPLRAGDTIRLEDGLSAVKLGSTGNINVNDLMNELVPPLTIVAYAGATAPTGWQICDGNFLKKNNGSFYLDSNSDKVPTPNLKGRTIIGTNQTAGSGISARRLGETGGAETHKLTVSEMPAHNHGAYTSYHGRLVFNINDSGKGGLMAGYRKPNVHQDVGVYEEADSTGTPYVGGRGGDQPHNNMQPYFVLNYIIKQPTADS